MSKRANILAGMAAGAAWAVLLVLLAPNSPLPPEIALAMAGMGPGLALAAMIARLSQRRFFDDTIIDGAPFQGRDAITQKVLNNTAEQALLALLIWPAAAVSLPNGSGLVLWLGAGFLIARVVFWLGYRAAPPLRAFGFAATFYPTLLAGALTLVFWLRTML